MFDQAYPMPRPVPLHQHASYGAALTLFGRQTLQLDVPPGTTAIRRHLPGGIPVTMLPRAYLPRAALRDLAGAGTLRGAVILAPDHPAPYLADFGAVPVMTPQWVAELALTDPDTMMAAMHQKWRNRLRHGLKQPLRITRRSMPEDAGHWLFRAEETMRTRRGYRGWPTGMTLAFNRANPGAAKLFTAHLGKHEAAAVLILRHGATASYHIAQSSDLGRAHSAPAVLLWAAAEYCAGKGHVRLDLGPIDTRNAPGLARFKLGSGAVPRPLGGTWLWLPRLGRLLSPLAVLDRRAMAPLA
ncbi:GNAT family N-acetyltransferase [Arenibacterium halophilum]|uniref:GNAT family N-acetyltransferase n=2 Tax=Arenibacterium halophilum TaxID=2583821 RepID=A0ABY2XBV1_9RHOB|nr:GNAT family N-acetyltransferase [Arenibacterium halophilum]